MLRSKNPQQECSTNATWSPPSRKQFCEKWTKSESHLVTNGSKEEAEKSMLISPEEDLRELLSALRTTEFCGKLNPTNFDHSLDDDEWVRLPRRRGGRGSGEKKTKRVIIPTPKEMYDEPHSCDTTVSSAASGDSGKKRSRGAFEYPIVTKEDEAVSAARFRRRLPQFGRATSMPLPEKRTQEKRWKPV